MGSQVIQMNSTIILQDLWQRWRTQKWRRNGFNIGGENSEVCRTKERTGRNVLILIMAGRNGKREDILTHSLPCSPCNWLKNSQVTALAPMIKLSTVSHTRTLGFKFPHKWAFNFSPMGMPLERGIVFKILQNRPTLWCTSRLRGGWALMSRNVPGIIWSSEEKPHTNVGWWTKEKESFKKKTHTQSWWIRED